MLHVNSKKKFPDETDGRLIREYIALRAKAYAFEMDNVEKIKAKGIRSHVVKNHNTTFEDHKKCLFGEKMEAYRGNVSIRSFKHQLHTIKSNKIT